MRRGLTMILVLLAGCSSGQTEEVLVSSAASLTDVFAEMEAAFETENPDVDIVLNLGGSSALREQILAGAPADVFASASQSNMDVITAQGLTPDGAAIFARNRLEIAVPVDNPGGVRDLADFGDDDLLIGLCAPAVPCGDSALAVLDHAGVDPVLDTNEADVRALLTKIEAGELDAGIVYTTDIRARSGTVIGIPIPDGHNVTADYPIAVLSAGGNVTGASAFVQFVLSEAGREILSEYGFLLP